MERKTEKLNLVFSPTEKSELDRLAKSKGLTKSQFIRSAIRIFGQSLIAA